MSSQLLSTRSKNTKRNFKKREKTKNNNIYLMNNGIIRYNLEKKHTNGNLNIYNKF